MDFTDASFDNKNLTEFNQLDNGDMVISWGYIRFHPGKFLIFSIADGEDEKLIAYDLTTKSLSTLLLKGRGPKELMFFRDIFISADDIYVSCPQDYKIAKIPYDENLRKFLEPELMTSHTQFMRAIPMGENCFLSIASASSGNRMHLLSCSGAVLDTLGIFPNIFVENKLNNNAVFQSIISVSPDCSKIVSVCLSFDIVDIYDNDFSLKKELRGPEYFVPEVKVVASAQGTRYIPTPSKNCYSGIVSTGNGFYTGYIGEVDEGRGKSKKRIRTIYSFDWDGNPKIAYRLPFEIQSFDVDEKNGLIYCIGMADDGDYHLYNVKM